MLAACMAARPTGLLWRENAGRETESRVNVKTDGQRDAYYEGRGRGGLC